MVKEKTRAPGVESGETDRDGFYEKVTLEQKKKSKPCRQMPGERASGRGTTEYRGEKGKSD